MGTVWDWSDRESLDTRQTDGHDEARERQAWIEAEIDAAFQRRGISARAVVRVTDDEPTTFICTARRPDGSDVPPVKIPSALVKLDRGEAMARVQVFVRAYAAGFQDAVLGGRSFGDPPPSAGSSG